MVYKDISFINLKTDFEVNPGEYKEYKASVLDRFFSFLIDYLIFSPVISFILLVLFQSEISIWKAGAASEITRSENLPILLLLGFSYLLLFSLAQSFFIYYLRATPGQHFLKLRVQIELEPGLVFFRIILRQISFWCSYLFLGLPWLAMLAHPQQKTFYDKLSETHVISLKARQNFYFFETESKYWRSLLATLLLFLSFLIFAAVWSQHDKIKNAAYTFNKLNKEKYFCSEFKSVELVDRLQTAIALNLVGQISDACVDKEANFVLWSMANDELKSLAYYAKSLTEKNPKSEQRYLQEACHFKKSEFFGCTVASAFLKKDLLSLYEFLKTKENDNSLLADVLKYELGLQLMKNDQRAENFKSLKKYDSNTFVKKYLISEVLAWQQSGPENKQNRIPASLSSSQKTTDQDLQYAQKLIEDL